MIKYNCRAVETDVLSAYITEKDIAIGEHFAIVLTNKNEEKISVLLNKEDAISLSNQIKEFVGE